MILEKKGVLRPLVIPKYDEVDIDIIQTLIRTAGITRATYLKHLRAC